MLSILTIQALVVFLNFARWPTTVTATKLTSWQKEKPHSKKKDLAQNFFKAKRTFFILLSFALGLFFLPRVFFFLPWGFSFCPEVFLFALRLVPLPWQPAGPPYLWNSVHKDSWFFSTCGYLWELAQTLHIWLAFIILAIEFVDWPVPKTLDIFVHVCQTSENKAFKTQHSVTVVREDRECDLISSHKHNDNIFLKLSALIISAVTHKVTFTRLFCIPSLHAFR